MSSPVANSLTTNSDDDQSRHKWQLQRQDTPSPNSLTTTPISTPSVLHTSSIILHDGSTTKRKSAFLPYRPQATVLTNLQRGNTEATFCPVEISLNFHERAGQGELTAEQVQAELRHQHNRNETIDFKDEFGFSALHWAAFYGQLTIVQLLAEAGAKIDVLAPEMVTPLLLAAAGGHHEIVRYLLDHGAKSTHMDILGNTALMYAAAGNHPHTCNEILSRDPDMTVTNEEGDTAYTVAVANGAHLAQAVLEQYINALLTL